MEAATAFELADWRRRVGELYARVRELGAGPAAWAAWRDGREQLYREHPQSPVPPARRAAFRFACFDHDPALRAVARVEPVVPVHRAGDADVPGMTEVATLHFTLGGAEQRLAAFWLDGYAGGLFVPFTDATSGRETYGGGRYVVDTAKGADLGTEGAGVVLDFNVAFMPSCAHDPRWVCPLATPLNRLTVPVRGGERLA